MFFLPQQAKECGCFMLHQEYVRARSFLRKLEIHFRKLPGLQLRVLNSFAKWQSLATTSVKDLQAEVEPLLKGQQYLLDEFATFFDDRSVPDSHLTDFEDVVLPATEQEAARRSGDVMEDVVLPECEPSKVLGSRTCPCRCHTEETANAHFKKRSKHCYLCGVKVRLANCFVFSQLFALFDGCRWFAVRCTLWSSTSCARSSSSRLLWRPQKVMQLLSQFRLRQ